MPLVNADGTYNAVIEIGRGDTAKMEVSPGDAHNPIVQDTHGLLPDGNPDWRYYAV